MKRTCLWLTRIYPAAWRRRYGVEYEEMLRACESAGPRDVADVLLHCASIWARAAGAPSQRPAAFTAAVFLALGALCVLAAMPGAEELRRSTSAFLLLSVLQVPAAAVVGFATRRRSGAPAQGVILLNTSVLLPALGLYGVSALLAANAVPSAQYWTNPNPTPSLRDFLSSREALLHWGRAAILIVALTVPAGWLFGLAGACLARLLPATGASGTKAS